MRRSLLPALLLVLLALLFWLLRDEGPEAGNLPQAEGGTVPAASAAADPALARTDLRLDEGRTEPAASPAAAGGWLLTGRAWNERGQLQAGVTIRLVPGAVPGWGQRGMRVFLAARADFAAAVTDAEGRFSIHLPSSPAPSLAEWSEAWPGLLCAEHAGQPALKPLPASFREHGGVCDLVLRAGAVLTGRVLTPDGAPAAYAAIASPAGLSWQCGADGGFRAPAPARRDFDLTFQHESGVLFLNGLQLGRADELALGDLVLHGPGRLAGRVILPDGSPAAQIRLLVTARRYVETRDAQADLLPSFDGRDYAETRTDAAGRFLLTGLSLEEFSPTCIAMGANVPLRAQGAPAEAACWLRAGPESDGHLLVLPWRLLLIDAPDFHPRMGSLRYEIHASAADQQDPPAAAEFRLLSRGYAGAEDFPIAFLYDSATWIRIAGAASAEATGTLLLAVPPEPHLQRAALPLEPFGATGTILVRGVSAAGAPLTRLAADVRDPATGVTVLGASVRPVPNGVELRNVPAGTWSVTLSCADLDAGRFVLPETLLLEAQAGVTNEVEWRPAEGGLLQIVVDTDGTGAANGAVPEITATVLAGPAHVGNLLNLVENGRERVRAARPQFPPATVMSVAGVLPPGVYRLRFAAAGFAPSERDIEVPVGDIVRVEGRLNAAD